MLHLRQTRHLLSRIGLAMVTLTLVTAAGTAQTTPPSADEDAYVAVVTADDVYLRSGASKSYYHFGKVKVGDFVLVTGKKFKWVRVAAVGPVFDDLYGLIKSRPGEASQIALDADGVHGVVTGRTEVYAPNLATSHPLKGVWKAVDYLPADTAVTVLEVVETETEVYHRIQLPESSVAWLAENYIRPATADEIKTWERTLRERTMASAPTQPATDAPAAAPVAAPAEAVVDAAPDAAEAVETVIADTTDELEQVATNTDETIKDVVNDTTAAVDDAINTVSADTTTDAVTTATQDAADATTDVVADVSNDATATVEEIMTPADVNPAYITTIEDTTPEPVTTTSQTHQSTSTVNTSRADEGFAPFEGGDYVTPVSTYVDGFQATPSTTVTTKTPPAATTVETPVATGADSTPTDRFMIEESLEPITAYDSTNAPIDVDQNVTTPQWDDVTAKPTIDMPAPTLDRPALPPLRTDFNVDDLEQRFELLQDEPIESAELAPLRSLYLSLVDREGSDSSVGRYSKARAEQLRIWGDLQQRRQELRQLRAQFESTSEDAATIRMLASREGEYAAVGRLTASTIYDGVALPRLLRLQDPTTGRTVAYVRPDASEGVDLFSLVGQLIGVAGEKQYDGGLRLNLVRPSRIDVLSPAG
ncbi:MAG: SH3 domain-containing protein [Planctomycetota bacterium]